MSAPVYRELPFEDVNPPPAPARQHISMPAVEDLAASIRVNGLLQPIGVVPNGDKFDIVYGHRRYLAHVVLEADTIRALVFTSTSEAMLGAQLAENIDRVDLSPTDEAIWFAQLWEALEIDTDELAYRLKKSRDYVEQRLLLLKGDQRVFTALAEGSINLSTAKLLNAYDDEGDRGVLLDAAVAGGATSRLVASWIADRRKIAIARGGAPAVDPTVDPAPVGEIDNALRCVYCESDEEPYYLVSLWIHKGCLNVLRRVLSNHLGGFSAQPKVTAPGPNADAILTRR